MGELLVPLPEDALREWFVGQRWFGSKATEVAHLNILESFTLREESPQLVLALIEARFPQGTHEVYQVPIGIRPASEGWGDRVIAEAGGNTYYDALADPTHARELLHLMRAGADVQAGDGMLAFRWAGGAGRGRDGRGAAGRRRAVELVDRVRRVADPQGVPPRRAGRQPGARAAALPVSERDFPHIAPIAGWYQYDGRLMDATLGVLQEYLAGATDGWDLALDALAQRPRGVPRRGARARRRHRRDAHRARLGGERPGVRARGAEQRGDLDPHRDDRRGDRADLRRAARGRGARPDPRPRAGRPGAPAGAGLGRRRRARDPHPRRLPPRPDHARRPRLGDPRLRGRAGAADVPAPAQALAAARRGGHAALVLLRGGRLRHPARRARRRRAGRSARARRSWTATSRPSTTALLPPGDEATRKLLSIFELEKAVYELRYELNNRPDWVAIPVAGIARLLESNGGS